MGNQEDTKPDCLDMLPSTSGTLDEDTFPSTTGHHILKRRFVSQEEENVDSSVSSFAFLFFYYYFGCKNDERIYLTKI